jgi:hypothetical protein
LIAVAALLVRSPAPFVRTLARDTTSASTARHQNAETAVLLDAADRTGAALLE